MRTRIIGIVVAVLLLLPATVLAGSDHKVTICHVPPGNPGNAHTITVDRHALKAHLGDNEQGLHGGDHYGPCTNTPTPTATASYEVSPEPTVTPSTEPSPEVSPEPTPTVTPTTTPSEEPSPTPTSTATPSAPVPSSTPDRTGPPTDTLSTSGTTSTSILPLFALVIGSATLGALAIRRRLKRRT